MNYPPVVIVDESDSVIGEAPLAEARRRGLIYRLVFIIVEDSRGRVLLQKRADNLVHFPGRWDISAGGHVDGGNGYVEAALDELQEEIGVYLKPENLKEAAYFYTETPELLGMYPPRYVRIFTTTLDDTPQDLHGGEVSEVRWFTKQEIKQLMQTQPELVAEGLQHAYHKVFARDRQKELVR